MRWVTSGTAAFRKVLAAAGGRGQADSAKVAAVVAEVIARVRTEGDAALAAYTRRFDGFDPRRGGFEVSKAAIAAAWRRTPASLRASLAFMSERISAFHRRQAEKGYFLDRPGARTGQRVLPVARAGVYVPGGKAAYPSTLLMNAVPAKVAGVGEVVAACAAPGGDVPDVVLAAARVAGVDRVFRIGGAQAIAALAFGTASVPAVDVIAGPGNPYVTEAKRQVYGAVGIDMLAGPSELVVLADRTADPGFVAADLLSQAEHAEDSFVALVTFAKALPEKVEAELARQARRLPRRAILASSMASAPGFRVRDLEEGVDVVNRLAPEHLSLAVADPWKVLNGIRNAGTAFLGAYSPVAVGDYVAGINHTLPTGGAARFSSPLGVATFLKRINVVSYTFSALSGDADHVTRLAAKEGLSAHAAAVRIREPRERRGK